MSVLLFELHGAEIAEGGMQTLAIVPNLNVFKDCGACLGMGCKLTGDTFRFQRTEETFRDCVVVTVANPAHAQLNVRACQNALVAGAGVLAALIGMMK